MSGGHTYDNKGIGGLYDNFRVLYNNKETVHKPSIVKDNTIITSGTSAGIKRKDPMSRQRPYKRRKHTKKRSLTSVKRKVKRRTPNVKKKRVKQRKKNRKNKKRANFIKDRF